MYEHTLMTCWSSLEEPCKDQLITKGGYQEAARNRIESLCRQIVLVYTTKYLGCILIREGIKPQPKKVQAILVLDPPYMWRCYGIPRHGTEYRDIWAKRVKCWPHSLTGRVRRNENHKEKEGETTLALEFDSSNSIWKCEIYHQIEVVLAYPCFSKPFEIYTDACTL